MAREYPERLGLYTDRPSAVIRSAYTLVGQLMDQHMRVLRRMDKTNIRIFTADDYPAIVDIHNSLNIVWPERPRTPEGWAEAERNRNPKCKYKRWVAVYDGNVVGFGSYGQSIYEYHP